MADTTPPTVTYAGEPFALCDGRAAAGLDAHSPVGRLPDALAVPSSWPGPDLNRLDLPLPPEPPLHLGLGDFFYPAGMSRYAVYRGLMAGDRVKKLGDLLSASPEAAQTFKLVSDGVTVSTPMHCLPPRPLSVGMAGAKVDDDLYLVTLVDDRYYRLERSAGKVWITAATSSDTWAGLMATLATALGVTLTVGSIPAVYGKPEPDSALYSNHAPAAALLDAAAANCGRVVVRKLDGTYELQTYLTARSNAATSRAALKKEWGGAVGPDSASAADPFRGPVVPRVTVSFPRWNLAGGWAEPAGNRADEYRVGPGDALSIEPALADLGAPYSAWAFGPGRKVVQTTAKAVYDDAADATANNLSGLTDLARQLTKDWYDLHRGALDESYPGVAAWTPDGSTDVVWSLGTGRATTRAAARPLNWGPCRFQHRVTDTGPAGLWMKVTGKDTSGAFPTYSGVLVDPSSITWPDLSPTVTVTGVKRPPSSAPDGVLPPHIETDGRTYKRFESDGKGGWVFTDATGTYRKDGFDNVQSWKFNANCDMVPKTKKRVDLYTWDLQAIEGAETPVGGVGGSGASNPAGRISLSAAWSEQPLPADAAGSVTLRPGRLA